MYESRNTSEAFIHWWQTSFQEVRETFIPVIEKSVDYHGEAFFLSFAMSCAEGARAEQTSLRGGGALKLGATVVYVNPYSVVHLLY